ncbi:uncharacterized proteins, homologs of lactam utilization protein B [Anaerolinea thermolimosa]|nr:uncharacterized proteins, homologs of lactam utilization protein B [Anaerolinea thermolimosa]
MDDRLMVDLNCDMGESFGRYTLGADAELLNWVTSANIACGLHAGDPLVMQEVVERALKKGLPLVRTRASLICKVSGDERWL